MQKLSKVKKKERLTHRFEVLLDDSLIKLKKKHRLKPHHVRDFIETYDNNGTAIESEDWQQLRKVLKRSPSLQLFGDIGAGKTHLVKQLVKRDRTHLYIVIDSHDEYEHLKGYTIVPDEINGNIRVRLNSQIEAAKPMFMVNMNAIIGRKFPDNYVLVVEEALRYKDVGLRNLMAESRKFIKVLAVMQEKTFDFCPGVKVTPFQSYS